jgi:hypothetical protein
MNNLYALFLRAMLAFSIAVGAPAAIAGPLYRVSLDTSSFAGSTGFLDLGFNGGGDMGQSIARLSNFSGNFMGDATYAGDATGTVAAGATLGNGTGENFFTQAVTFGGLFSFDVAFELGNEPLRTLFTVALFNDAFDAYLGADAELLSIDVIAGKMDDVTVNAPGLAQVAQIAEVPEPGEWLLLATGLLLIVATRRMQQRG